MTIDGEFWQWTYLIRLLVQNSLRCHTQVHKCMTAFSIAAVFKPGPSVSLANKIASVFSVSAWLRCEKDDFA